MKRFGRIALVFILTLAVVGCSRESGEPGMEPDSDSRKTQIDAGGDAPEKTVTQVGSTSEKAAMKAVESREISISGFGGTFTVSVPADWECVGLPQTEENSSYSFRIKPDAAADGFISISYEPMFGVCGTGLEQRETELAGDKAVIGYYDGSEEWSFIIYQGKNEKIVALNQAPDWSAVYQGQIIAVLDSLQFEPDHVQKIGRIAYPANTAFGVSLTVKNVSKTGADLYFSRYSGDPEHTIYYGEAYGLQVFDETEQAWKDVDFDSPPVFVDIAYRMPYGEIVDFHVDWEAGCGSLAPGLYSISKTLIDDNYDPTSDGSGRAEVGACFIIY